jgi:hypothetical protein
MVPIAQGHLVITSHRTIFAGQRTVVVPHTRLAAFEAYADALQVGREDRVNPQYFQVPDGEYAAAILAGASQSGEVRPVYGQSAYVYTMGDAASQPVFLPDDGCVIHAEVLLEQGDEYSLSLFLSSLPKLSPGSVVDIGNIAGLHVEARPQAGPFAGRWGYVLFSEAHLQPPR